MPDGSSATENPVIETPLNLEQMPDVSAEASPLTDETASHTPIPTDFLNGPEGTTDDLRATLEQMRAIAGEKKQPKDVTPDYVPEKPVGKIRQFLKRHPVLAPFMAPIAGIAALMMLLLRSAFKSTKERQGQ